ncbi:MAG: hypothetical protein KDK05_26765 [Candidatus Competibacteraceae bacterium]|nr:hypothetical protein [Candidatus Competibacteraceae bacterium]
MSNQSVAQKTVTITWQEKHEFIAMKIRLEHAVWHLQRALELLDEQGIKGDAQQMADLIEQKIEAARRVA